jgi:hypothetical protein
VLTQVAWFGVPLAGVLGFVFALVRRYRGSVNRDAEGVLRYVYGGVKYSVGRVLNPALSAQLSLRRYGTQRLGGAPRVMRVPGLRPRSLEISKYYIGLSLSSESQPIPDLILLALEEPVVVLGEPGAGKSSMVSMLYRSMCAGCISHPQSMRLPVRLELKNLRVPDGDLEDDAADTWLLDVVRRAVISVNTYRVDVLFERMVSTRGVFVLLDGFDEVPAGRIEQLVDLLARGTRRLQDLSERNAVLLTSRPQAYAASGGPLQAVFQSEYSIERLTPLMVEQVVRGWPYLDNGYSTSRTVLRHLADNSAMVELGTNPLVLAMFIAHVEYMGADQAVVAETRTEFYKIVLGELLYRRRRRQGHRGYGHLAVKEQRNQFLTTLAARHLLDPSQPANSVPMSLVNECYPRTVPAEKRTDWLQDLMAETGLLEVERTDESLRFMHLSFCEYFAALHCLTTPKSWKALVDGCQGGKSFTARVTQVGIMAIAMSDRDGRDRMLSDLAPVVPRQLLLQAAAESQYFDAPPVVKALKSEWAEASSLVDSNVPYDTLSKLVNLIMLVRDSRRVAEALGADPPLGELTPASMLSLYSDGQFETRTLVSQMAEHDLDEAVAFARAAGVSEAETVRSLVNNASSEMLLDTGLRGIGSTRSQDVLFWCTVLSAAALSRRQVAEELCPFTGRA